MEPHPEPARLPLRGAVIALATLAAQGCDTTAFAGDLSLEGAPRWTLTEEVRLGNVDDPEAGFSRVTGVAVDADGQVYVGEGQDAQIRVYSSDGEPLQRIGRRGQGPGEFQNAPRFGVVGDTVWAFDQVGDRITLFRRDGTLLSTARAEAVIIPLPAALGFVLPGAMHDDGLFSSEFARVAVGDAPPSGDEAASHPRVPRVRFTVEGEVVDTVGWDPSPPPRMVPPPGHQSYFESIEVAGRRHRVPPPPTVLPVWFALADGRIVVDAPIAPTADQGTVMVTRIGLAGDTVFHRVLPYTPRPYTSAQLDSIAQRGARGQGVFVQGRTPEVPDNVDAIAARLRAELAFPEFRPAIQYPWLADDEGIWLRIDDPDPAVSRWVVLDPDGIPRGEVELAPGARPLWNRGDQVWILEEDDFDVPWVVRYRITTDGEEE